MTKTQRKKIKTYKVAKETGLRIAEKWVFFGLYPKPRCKPLIIKDRDFYSKDQCELVASKVYWEREGRMLKRNAKVVGQKVTHYGGRCLLFDVYQKSSTIEKL
ncbi:MAG: hypothetical protein ACI86H_002242 [bacterium]|jgi:hypothetical protein